MTHPPIVDAWAQVPTRPDQVVPEVRRLLDVLLLSAWHRPGRWVLSNDDVAAVVAGHPGRFAGIASSTEGSGANGFSLAESLPASPAPAGRPAR